MKKAEKLLSVLRIVIGFIFLWAFFDKLFGLGFDTAPAKSWLSGTSPTAGFLKFGTHGFFSTFFQSLAGSVLVDIFFMAGLFGVGIAFILGISLRIAGYSGALMVFLIYLSLFPPQHNPLIDEHVVYFFLFLLYAKTEIGRKISLYNWWRKTKLVKRFPILK